MRSIVTGGAGSGLEPGRHTRTLTVLLLRSCGTLQLAPPVLEPRSTGTSLLAQHYDIVIIDNLATVPGRENIEHLLAG